MQKKLIPHSIHINFWRYSETYLHGSNRMGILTGMPNANHRSEDLLSRLLADLVRFINKILAAFGFTITLMAAMTPSVLVVMDRWFDSTLSIPLFQAGVNQWINWFGYGFPNYFGLIVTSMVLLTGIFLLVPGWSRMDGFLRNPVSTSQNPPSPRLYNKRTFRVFLGLNLMVVLGIIFILYCSFNQIEWSGANLVVIILIYMDSQLLLDVRWDGIKNYFRQTIHWIFPLLLFHVSFILFLADLQNNTSFEWLPVILLLGTGIYLFKVWRYVPVSIWIIHLALLLFSLATNAWWFSFVGDEYSFFDNAYQISAYGSLENIFQNLFNGQLVYGAHPYFSTIIQVIFMKLFGENGFAWRFSSQYLAAVSIGFFFLFFRRFFSRSVSLLACGFMAVSSYLMAFSKIGYNNLQAIFVLSIALATAGWAVQSRKTIAYTMLGFCCGLAFYVFPAALYGILPVILLLVYFDPPISKDAGLRWFKAAVSFILLIFPLFFQPGYWIAKLPGLFISDPTISRSFLSIVKHLVSQTVYTFISYFYSAASYDHFVSSSLMDPITGIFILPGILICISYMKTYRFLRLWLLSFISMGFMAGVTHSSMFPPMTRMFMLIPFWALFASLGVRWMWIHLRTLVKRTINWQTYANATIMVCMLFGLVQAYGLSYRSEMGSSNDTMYLIRLMQNIHKVNKSRFLRLIIFDNRINEYDGARIFPLVYNLMGPGEDLIYYPYQEGTEISDYQWQQIKDNYTVIMVSPRLDNALQEEINQSLQDTGKVSCGYRGNPDAKAAFTIWVYPHFQSLCVP